MIYSIKDNNLNQLFTKGITVIKTESSVSVEYSSEYLTTKFLYYAVKKDNIYFSFDFFELEKEISPSIDSLNINNEVLPFFIEKGYTPFDKTYLKEISKLPNLVKMIYDFKSQKVSYKLTRIVVDQKVSKEEIIEKSIVDACDREKKNFILFSGGYDSTLVSMIAKKILPHNNIELLTGNLISSNFIPNTEDVKYSNILAKQLGLDINIIDKDINKISNKDLENIIYNRPTSAHFSIVYQSIKEFLEQSYNGNYHIISGQQADSVLNFGATSFLKFKGRERYFEGKGELALRFLYLSSPVYTRLLFKIFNPDLPTWGYVLSPLVGKNKLPIIKNKNVFESLFKSFSEFLEKFNKEDSEYIRSSFLLIYTFTFLSGSDAAGVISTFGSDKSLPFSNKGLLWYFIETSINLFDKIIPKRPIMNLINKDKTIWNTIKKRPNTPPNSYLEIFYNIGKRLNLEDFNNDMQKKYGLELPYCFNTIHLLKCLEKSNNNYNLPHKIDGNI